MVSAMITQS